MADQRKGSGKARSAQHAGAVSRRSPEVLPFTSLGSTMCAPSVRSSSRRWPVAEINASDNMDYTMSSMLWIGRVLCPVHRLSAPSMGESWLWIGFLPNLAQLIVL